MNLNWGRAYALGVRQAIYRAHRNDSRMLIMTFDNGVMEKIPFEKMQTKGYLITDKFR